MISSKPEVARSQDVTKENKLISIESIQIETSENVGEKEAYTKGELKEIQSHTFEESKISLPSSDTIKPHKRKVDEVINKTEAETKKQTTTASSRDSMASQEEAKKRKEDKHESQQTQTGLTRFSIKPRKEIKPFDFGNKDEKQGKGRE